MGSQVGRKSAALGIWTIMLRNRKEQDEGHLRGVVKPRASRGVKFGSAETLQNVIPAGKNSWKKKRGLHYLDFAPPEEIIPPFVCPDDTVLEAQGITFYPGDAYGAVLYGKNLAVANGRTIDDTMSMSAGHIESGGLTK